MGTVCARCGGVFRGRWALMLLWCKVDEFYVCRRCWKWECHEGHGKGKENVGTNSGEVAAGIFAIAGFTIVMIGSWAVVDGIQVAWYASLPTTPIANLPAQGLVKVQGTILDTDPVAWSGREVNGEGGWSWEWDPRARFQVQDATGEVNVTTNRWWAVEGTAHPSGLHVGSVYLPGDTVLVVGDVVGLGAGRHLEVLYASPDGFLVNPGLPLFLGSLCVAPFVAVAVHYARVTLRRSSLHRERVQVVPKIELRFEHAVRDDSLPWRSNRVRSQRRRLGIALSFVALSVLAIVWIWAGLTPHTRSDFYAAVVLAAMVPPLGALFPLSWVLYKGPVPTAMALSDRGVHFWYASPYERRLADGFASWDEIEFVGVRGSGDSATRSLERKSGAKDDVDFLSRENWTELVNEWQRRRGTSPGPPAT